MRKGKKTPSSSTPISEDDEKRLKLIYFKQRYSENSPMTVYIPTKDIMFKMMRACLGCQNIEDLWIFNEDHTQM